MENQEHLRGRFEGEVLTRLTSIEAKLGELATTASAAAVKANEAAGLAAGAVTAQADHETRLRALEESGTKDKGRNSVINAGIAVGISILGIIVSWYAK